MTVDSGAMVATGMLTVEGGSGRLLAIDMRSADERVYGVFENGTLATIGPATAVATPGMPPGRRARRRTSTPPPTGCG